MLWEQAGQVVTISGATPSAISRRLWAMASAVSPNAMRAPPPVPQHSAFSRAAGISLMFANLDSTFRGRSYIFMWRPRSHESWMVTVSLTAGSGSRSMFSAITSAMCLTSMSAIKCFG